MFFADHARNFDAIKTRLEGWVGDTAGRGVCSGIAWYQIVGRFFFLNVTKSPISPYFPHGGGRELRILCAVLTAVGIDMQSGPMASLDTG